MPQLQIKKRSGAIFTVLYDEMDEHIVAANKWQIVVKDGRPYAIRHPYVKGRYISIYLHREIMNAPGGSEIDHKDDNSLNNKRDNLRIATREENSRNKKKYSKNTSGYKGVSFSRDRGKFETKITVNYKTIHGGRFNTAEEAAIRYNELAIQYHGEFAHLNKIHI